MTTIKLYDGDCGGDTLLVRCNLAQASAPIETYSEEDESWSCTQYQCADARHTTNGLASIAKQIAAQAFELPASEFDCDWVEVE